MTKLEALLPRKMFRIPGIVSVARKLLSQSFSNQNEVGVTFRDCDGTHFMGAPDSTRQFTIEVQS